MSKQRKIEELIDPNTAKAMQDAIANGKLAMTLVITNASLGKLMRRKSETLLLASGGVILLIPESAVKEIYDER